MIVVAAFTIKFRKFSVSWCGLLVFRWSGLWIPGLVVSCESEQEVGLGGGGAGASVHCYTLKSAYITSKYSPTLTSPKSLFQVHNAVSIEVYDHGIPPLFLPFRKSVIALSI